MATPPKYTYIPQSRSNFNWNAIIDPSGRAAKTSLQKWPGGGGRRGWEWVCEGIWGFLLFTFLLIRGFWALWPLFSIFILKDGLSKNRLFQGSHSMVRPTFSGKNEKWKKKIWRKAYDGPPRRVKWKSFLKMKKIKNKQITDVNFWIFIFLKMRTRKTDVFEWESIHNYKIVKDWKVKKGKNWLSKDQSQWKPPPHSSSPPTNTVEQITHYGRTL